MGSVGGRGGGRERDEQKTVAIGQRRRQWCSPEGEHSWLGPFLLLRWYWFPWVQCFLCVCMHGRVCRDGDVDRDAQPFTIKLAGDACLADRWVSLQVDGISATWWRPLDWQTLRHVVLWPSDMLGKSYTFNLYSTYYVSYICTLSLSPSLPPCMDIYESHITSNCQGQAKIPIWLEFSSPAVVGSPFIAF